MVTVRFKRSIHSKIDCQFLLSNHAYCVKLQTTWIESIYQQSLHPVEMFKLLKEEDLNVSFATLTHIIRRPKLVRSTKKGTSTGRPIKLNAEGRAFIEDQLRKDDETTSCAIQEKLAQRRVMVPPSTVQRSRKQQGLTFQPLRCCQLVRDANKVKHLELAQKV